MFDRFTDPARMLLGYARREAQRLGHDYIGTEHMLLGLLRGETSVAVRVLLDLGAVPGDLVKEAEEAVERGGKTMTMGQLPFTPRAKGALESALREAQTFGDDYIGTEHVLLGLIQSEGVGARVLAKHGVELEAARKAIVALFASGYEREEGPDVGRLRTEALRQMRGRAGEGGLSIRRGTALVLLPESESSTDLLEQAIRPALAENGIPAGTVHTGPPFDAETARGQAGTLEVVIADVSGRDPEVCFELGRVVGLGRRPLLLAHDAGELPRALGEHPVILYEDGPKALAALAARLADTIRGYLVASREEAG